MTAADHPILLLFDIDGTMVRTGGRAGRLMIRATEELTGHTVSYEINNFIGRTDRIIIRRFLEQIPVPEPDVERLIDEIVERYLSYVVSEMRVPGNVEVISGVENILKEVRRHPRFRLGLLTGNLKIGARAKLQPVGLDVYFPVGAFGDDAEDRNCLPDFALRRAELHYGDSFSRERSWIIGDSTRDIECAVKNGLRCLAVATGHITEDELAAHDPDVVLENLEDTAKVVEYFLSVDAGEQGGRREI